jgi:hypothetical protein
MPVSVGNRFWRARSSKGDRPQFLLADDLWRACLEYFEWVDQNPLFEDKVVTFQGTTTHEPVAKMRAMSLAGLRVFVDIDRKSWQDFKTREDFASVVSRVEDVIFAQKFEGAAVDVLNASLIARELGLADKQEVEIKGSLAERVARAKARADVSPHEQLTVSRNMPAVAATVAEGEGETATGGV